ncbi:MAG: hypothetical protein JWM34_1116 [Ilumatobacteraceae bacterium]|nr:hypothetical protein [Ilumatobacteraceae bacterium]
MTFARRSVALAPLAALLVAVGFGGIARADTSTTGPTVSLNRTTVDPGDHIILTLNGFTTTYVTISVCGNEARRGSTDCNMTESEGRRLNTDGTPTLAQIPVGTPPADCPCVIRVSTRGNEESAVTPIVITGQPVSPVVDSPTLGNPIDLSIEAHPHPRGVLETLRSGLGGPTRYDVTVSVKNHSNVPLGKIQLYGSAGSRSDDNLAALDLAVPGLIAPGQTWHQTVSAVVPAPSFGSVTWSVTASGGGPTITSTSSTRHRQILLIVIVLLLAADVGFLLIRVLVRRHARKAADADAGRDGSTEEGDPIDVDSRELADA